MKRWRSTCMCIKNYEDTPVDSLSLSNPWMGKDFELIRRLMRPSEGIFINFSPNCHQTYYLTDFPRLQKTEAASYERRVKKKLASTSQKDWMVCLMKCTWGCCTCFCLLYGLVGRVFTNGLGSQGFNPKLRHTKDFRNDTWYFLA